MRVKMWELGTMWGKLRGPAVAPSALMIGRTLRAYVEVQRRQCRRRRTVNRRVERRRAIGRPTQPRTRSEEELLRPRIVREVADRTGVDPGRALVAVDLDERLGGARRHVERDRVAPVRRPVTVHVIHHHDRQTATATASSSAAAARLLAAAAPRLGGGSRDIEAGTRRTI